MEPLLLNYPVKGRVTQKFGDNKACVSNSTGRVCKAIFGWCPPNTRNLYKANGMLGHNGIDFKVPIGTPVYHAGPSGRVDEISNDMNRGLGVGIKSDDKYSLRPHTDICSQVRMRYWHLSKVLVQIGDPIQPNQLIGYSGNTGSSSNPHLHFELKPVIDTGQNIFQNNGYMGAVNPLPFFK